MAKKDKSSWNEVMEHLQKNLKEMQKKEMAKKRDNPGLSDGGEDNE